MISSGHVSGFLCYVELSKTQIKPIKVSKSHEKCLISSSDFNQGFHSKKQEMKNSSQNFCSENLQCQKIDVSSLSVLSSQQSQLPTFDFDCLGARRDHLEIALKMAINLNFFLQGRFTNVSESMEYYTFV